MNSSGKNLRIGITGSTALVGFHLKAFLFGKQEVSLKCADRFVFDDERLMDDFVRDLDVIVHLAYINRGSDEEVGRKNTEFASRIVESCERTAASAGQIVFSSSSHIYRDTLYGKSKKACAEIFRRWADANRTVFSNFIFPHIFGEYGKPFSNSVVSTFCHQIADGETPSIDHDGDLELIHAQDVARLIYQAIRKRNNQDILAQGQKMKVSEMLVRLQGMAGRYQEGVIPDLREEIALQLFNTYRSYLFPHHYPVSLVTHADDRGGLFEVVKSDHGGQTFLSTTKPGITRGNHFHYHKVERFLVVEGEAVIALRKLYSNEITEFVVSGLKPQFVDIPTLYTHNIKNTGNSVLTTLFWSHEIFDPANSDTFFEPVYVK